ncbi:N-acyl homoserine lactonase family protein [Sphingomonas oligophenolica]|uniref:N-acyl homoserine lactonase family protein n=1 Tax=Sphingomonas oligophenolica TaxID=301154 RepID=A0A502CHB2_9SPHN|nr:N-acyl homoserine lactonase family protein [Sphingomonas oligophenolica]TPG12193.1 N-acyl homoserine lactonase family protein [Sphingomonas oligophenolica]
MRIVATFAFAAAAVLALSAQAAPPATATPEVELWRLECGAVRVNDLNAFSDTRAYPGQSRDLVASCYLIRHGTDYMLWDTGLPAGLLGKPQDKTSAMSPTLAKTIVAQLATIGVTPAQITRVGISHYHFDHIGQAAAFPQAELLIGKGDADALAKGEGNVDAKPLAPWFGGGAKLTPVSGDKDVFGDGSVTMIDLPGHTPGHHGLLVKLAKTGPVLLSGDVAHFHENLDGDGVPPFNTERADSLASMDRYRKLGAALRAVMVIQHDPRDVALLPAFPKAAD